MRSLQTRILLAAALVLVLFLFLTSLALERAFQDAARAAREQRLLGQIYLLLAAAELSDGGLVFPQDLAEPRFDLPGSGLYARVFDGEARAVWASRSTMDTALPPSPIALEPGERHSTLTTGKDEPGHLTQGLGVLWATGQRPQPYTFAVAEDLADLKQEVGRFRRSLAGWLGLMALLLLTTLVATMRWGLRPLRRVATEVAAIEAGAQARLVGDYPRELQSLTDNLNALLTHEQAQRRRLDHALGDLAHSLKTPLAVIATSLADLPVPPETLCVLQDQLHRMEQLADYQLRRARSGAGAAAGLAPPVPIRPVIERLVMAVTKVHRDKAIDIGIRCDARLVFRGPEADLMEILGNLLDNAMKWGRREIRITVLDEPALQIHVEDDGPGIPLEQRERLLERGARADELTPGFGIGLAVVRELCAAYAGDLHIARSPLGGAHIQARMG